MHTVLAFRRLKIMAIAWIQVQSGSGIYIYIWYRYKYARMCGLECAGVCAYALCVGVLGVYACHYCVAMSLVSVCA